jgi:hypothetical protein
MDGVKDWKLDILEYRGKTSQINDTEDNAGGLR